MKDFSKVRKGTTYKCFNHKEYYAVSMYLGRLGVNQSDLHTTGANTITYKQDSYCSFMVFDKLSEFLAEFENCTDIEPGDLSVDTSCVDVIRLQDGTDLIDNRTDGKYTNRSIYLGLTFDWELKVDESAIIPGTMILIPTRKK